MISKELLSKVNGEVKDYDGFFAVKQKGHACKEDLDAMEINIYELAHMCKEWAFNSFGSSISSAIVDDGKEWWCGIGIVYTIDFYADTEPEAIFKACQWILENK